ncbi:hypothetical protein, partial [Streptomyces sp. P17]|uniref:hypothetical protein n=1 Tax=Streptomyces sp. P17 TaxID=3074716 RepID=UPI0028F3E9BB
QKRLQEERLFHRVNIRQEEIHVVDDDEDIEDFVDDTDVDEQERFTINAKSSNLCNVAISASNSCIVCAVVARSVKSFSN